MSYCRKCGAQLPDGASFCSNCGTRIISETKPVEKHRVLKVTGKPKLVVANTAPGSVEVDSGPNGQVTVDLDLRESEDIDCNISQDGDIITVNCRVKSGFWGWPSYIFRTGAKVKIVVTVPSEADLDLETRAGRIAVTGIQGAIMAESSAGSVNIQECKGPVKARTRAGTVKLENVEGTVSARTSAGSIRFLGVLSKAESWFRTSVGAIDITLRGQPDLTVEASTTLGSISCTPELIDTRSKRNWYTGRIGAGTGKLIAETKTGSIRIKVVP